jgi:hypothetical protein
MERQRSGSFDYWITRGLRPSKTDKSHEWRVTTEIFSKRRKICPAWWHFWGACPRVLPCRHASRLEHCVTRDCGYFESHWMNKHVISDTQRRSWRRKFDYWMKEREAYARGSSACPRAYMSTSAASSVWRPQREIKLISTTHCVEYQRLSW